MQKRSMFYFGLSPCIGFACLAVVVVSAMAGLIYTPYNPIEPDFLARLQPPSFVHPFGTDAFGRDILSRILAGATTSLSIAVSAISIALAGGGLFGAAGGYAGGLLDRVMTMMADALLAMPGILLALGIMATIGPSLYGLVFALGLAYSPIVYRIMRSAVFSIREKEYVEASRALGNSEIYTVICHIIPNCLSPLIILGTALCASAILAEAALSFLGLGVPPPHPSWGGMLAESRSHFTTAPWLSVLPGLAISLALLGINLTGDFLRDYLDPRMRGL